MGVKMGATIKINGERKIRIRNKKLLEDLIKVLSEYSRFRENNDSDIDSSEIAGDDKDNNEQSLPESMQEAFFKSRKNLPFNRPGSGASKYGGNYIPENFIKAVQSYFNRMNNTEDIIEKADSGSPVTISFESASNNNSLRGTDTDILESGEGENSKEKTFLNNAFTELNKSATGFTASTGTAYKKMWEGLISEGNKVKGPWDALWLSLKNSAVKRMGEILKNAVIDEIFSSKIKSGNSGGILTSIFSAIGGLFSDVSSGTSGKIITGTAANKDFLPVTDYAGFTASYPEGSELAGEFRKYADAAEKWQREIRVVNDLFENNRGIIAVQKYLSKIKS
jgi:hypothetical protein